MISKKNYYNFFSENKNESLIQKEKLNIGLIQKYKKWNYFFKKLIKEKKL